MTYDKSLAGLEAIVDEMVASAVEAGLAIEDVNFDTDDDGDIRFRAQGAYICFDGEAIQAMNFQGRYL